MIASFKTAATDELFRTGSSRRLPSTIWRVGLRNLKEIAAAENLNILGAHPGNHLEALKGDRKGQHSIRVNDKYRICFVWRDGEAHFVEIVDYH
jgi:proteic killer suppression protein